MRAWTVDADDIEIAEDFSQDLLQRTPSIDEFLDANRSDKLVVTGTKGYGKTLLLKAKRVLVQDRALCIPENSLLDKPVGDKIFSSDMVSMFGDSTLQWRKVWLLSICVAVLKPLSLLDDIAPPPALAALVADRHLHGVIDHFVNVLGWHRSELFDAAEFNEKHLIPRLRRIGRPVAVFIDSVDEYFNKHIQSPAPRASDAGEVSANIWYFSQIALVEAAYQLRRVTHHLKVFAAVRKEALLRFAPTDAMAQQYQGSVVDLTYSKTTLREIFSNNIRTEREKNLAAPQRLKHDPIAAFTGVTHLAHSYTNEEEEIFDYIYRHTLRRPRDFMTVGRRLAQLAPADRRDVGKLKSAVNGAATEIAQEYLAEIAPYIGEVDMDAFLGVLPRHILTIEELETAANSYDRLRPIERSDTQAPGGRQLFSLLYRSGLLGYVLDDITSGQAVQRFLAPGEGVLDRHAPLPRSSHHLVHPVLTEVIGKLNPGYARRIDRVNIVGDGRRWHDADDHDRSAAPLYVLKADVHQFSALMGEDAEEVEVRRRYERAVRAHAGDCLAYELAEGDSLTVVGDDPTALITAGMRIMQDLSEAPRNPRLRVAVAFGPVRLTFGDGGRRRISGGEGVLLAARVEPVVAVNQIWLTEEVKDALDAGTSFYRGVAVAPPDEFSAAGGGGAFNVRKPRSDDPDIFVKLYRAEPR